MSISHAGIKDCLGELMDRVYLLWRVTVESGIGTKARECKKTQAYTKARRLVAECRVLLDKLEGLLCGGRVDEKASVRESRTDFVVTKHL